MKKLNLCTIGLLSILCLFGCSNKNYDDNVFTTTDDLYAVMEISMNGYDNAIDNYSDTYYQISDYNYQYNDDKETIEINIKVSHYDDDEKLLKGGTMTYLAMLIDTNYTIYESFEHPSITINVYNQNGDFILSNEFQYGE